MAFNYGTSKEYLEFYISDEIDDDGNPKLKSTLPFQSDGKYRFERTLLPNQTAIVVMDPWVDMPSQKLNEYFGEILESHIIPFSREAWDRGPDDLDRASDR